MRKHLLYKVAVILSTCLYSHVSFTYSRPGKPEHLDKINFEYLCQNKLFDRKTIGRSYRKGCFQLWNAESSNGFPAKLEDDQFVNGAHRTLFSWPLNNDIHRNDIRYNGNCRTVFDIKCRFHGVVWRRQVNHYHCTKLFDRNDIDNNRKNHEEYDIHRCGRAVFGQTYLQDSIKAALKAGLNQHPQRFPRVHQIISEDEIIYKWPLHLDDEIHGTFPKKSYNTRHYVLFTNDGGVVGVIDQVQESLKDCLRETKFIETSSYDSNIIGAQEHIYDSKKSYDCSGQIFTDKYIQEIFSTIRGEIVDSSFTKSRRDAYPKLVDIGPENAMGKSWIWDLRIQEGDYMKSKRRYVIAVDRKYETSDVFLVEQGKYIVCTTRYKPDTPIAKSLHSSPEVDIEYSDRGQCNYSSERQCEDDGPNPKRWKISIIDPDTI